MNTTPCNRTLCAFTLAVCLGWASPLWAQGSREADPDGWAPVKHLEFTDEDVQGGWLGPEGELIHATQRAVQPSLIEIRQGFEAEVIKTLENL
jgi:hypothetical protein